MMKHIKIGRKKIGNDLPLTIIAGPCVIESRDHAIKMATALKEISEKIGVHLIYKSSFDKANRTSIDSFRGVEDLTEAYIIFDEIRKVIGLPVLTDIHTAEQCMKISPYVDVLQIPAFLCRQTDFLLAAAKAAKMNKCAVNVKKGQFLAPWDMKNVVTKLETIHDQIMLTDRGTSFGYNTLVSDMRGLPIMAELGYPVIFDATHSVQQPGGQGTTSGGQREYVPHLARAAVAVGVAAVFMEVHDDPDNALSDGPNSIHLDDFEPLVRKLVELDKVTKDET